MATANEVLQKVNEYCTEKQYTLKDDFRSKYSEKFAAAYPESDVNEETTMNSIKFNIDTAFSAASKEIKNRDQEWKTKEAEYLKQIDAFKKTSKTDDISQKGGKIELPEDIKNKLEKFDKFQIEQQRQEKIGNVLRIAKTNVREDLHNELKLILDMMSFNENESDIDIATKLTANFTELYKNKIGNIKPQSPISQDEKYSELLKNVPKANVY